MFLPAMSIVIAQVHGEPKPKKKMPKPIHETAIQTFGAHADLAAIPKEERSRRNRMLRILSQKKEHAFYRAHLGTVQPVLWEGADHDGATGVSEHAPTLRAVVVSDKDRERAQPWRRANSSTP